MRADPHVVAAGGTAEQVAVSVDVDRQPGLAQPARRQLVRGVLLSARMRSVHPPTADRVQLREPLECALNTHRGIVSRTDRDSPGGEWRHRNERECRLPGRLRDDHANGIGNTAPTTNRMVCWKPSAAPLLAWPASSAGRERQTVPAHAQRRGDHEGCHEQPDRRPDRCRRSRHGSSERDRNRRNGTTRLRITSDQRPASTLATEPRMPTDANRRAADAVDQSRRSCRNTTRNPTRQICGAASRALPPASFQSSTSRRGSSACVASQAPDAPLLATALR